MNSFIVAFMLWFGGAFWWPEAPARSFRLLAGEASPGGVLPPILGVFRGDTPQKRQKWRSGPILGATANFGASIL